MCGEIRRVAKTLIYEAVMNDGYEVVIVKGRPGGGKSRLRQELTRALTDGGVVVTCYFPTYEDAHISRGIDEKETDIDFDFAAYKSALSVSTFRSRMQKVAIFDGACRMQRDIGEGDIFDLALSKTKTWAGGKIVVLTDSAEQAADLKAKYGERAILLELPSINPAVSAEIEAASEDDDAEPHIEDRIYDLKARIISLKAELAQAKLARKYILFG